MPNRTGARCPQCTTLAGGPHRLERHYIYKRRSRLWTPLCLSRVFDFSRRRCSSHIPREDACYSPIDTMAVFSDLHTADGLKSLEAHLAGKTYVSG